MSHAPLKFAYWDATRQHSIAIHRECSMLGQRGQLRGRAVIQRFDEGGLKLAKGKRHGRTPA